MHFAIQVDLYEYILAAAFLVAAYFRLKGRRSLPFFSAFIFIVVFFEFIFEPLWTAAFNNNHRIFNIYAIVGTYYYMFVFMYRKWSRERNYGLLLIVSGWIIYSISRLVFPQHENAIDALNYNVGMGLVSFFILDYFYSVLYRETYNNIFRDPYFYFGLGILMFYAASFPIITFINVLVINEDMNMAYSNLLTFGNIFLSLAYLGTAICSYRKTTLTG